MKDEYKIDGSTAKLEVSVEKFIVETLQKMSSHTKFTVDELVNTALKRYIASHKDFLPRTG